MEQKVTSTATKGVVIGLIMIVVALAIAFSGMEMNGPLQYIIYAVYIAGLIYSIHLYGKEIDHNSTFGNYFAHGFKIAALVTIIMIAYVIIFMYAFPEFKEKAMDTARKQMAANKNMTSDQVDKAMDITRRFFTVFLIGGALVGYLFIGAIASLIGAGVTKKNPHPVTELDQIA